MTLMGDGPGGRVAMRDSNCPCCRLRDLADLYGMALEDATVAAQRAWDYVADDPYFAARRPAARRQAKELERALKTAHRAMITLVQAAEGPKPAGED